MEDPEITEVHEVTKDGSELTEVSIVAEDSKVTEVPVITEAPDVSEDPEITEVTEIEKKESESSGKNVEEDDSSENKTGTSSNAKQLKSAEPSEQEQLKKSIWSITNTTDARADTINDPAEADKRPDKTWAPGERANVVKPVDESYRSITPSIPAERTRMTELFKETEISKKVKNFFTRRPERSLDIRVIYVDREHSKFHDGQLTCPICLGQI